MTGMRQWVAGLALAGGLFAAQAGAAIVTSGATVSISGTTVAARPELAGDVLQDITVPFDLTVSSRQYVGSVRQQVVKEASAGTIDLYYLLSLESGSRSVDEIAALGFGGFATDMDYRSDWAAGQSPTIARRSDDGQRVSWGNPFASLSAGQSTPWVLVRTDATDYGEGGSMLLIPPTGSGPSITGLYQPIPEPAGIAIVFMGAGLLLLRQKARS